MLALGALALYRDDVTTATPPPPRPNRNARRSTQGAGILGILRQLRGGVSAGLAEACGVPHFVSRSYPY